MFKAATAKFFGRTGTRSKYGKTPERHLPPAQEETTEIVEQSTAAETKKDEETDRKVEEQEGKKEVEKAGVMTKLLGKKTVEKNVASNKAGTSNTGIKQSFYNRFWAIALTHSLHAVQFTDNVWFVPNAIPLFTMCNIFFELVGRSNWIDRHEPTFNPYAAATAICYLYYIQILRAKEAAGALEGHETSVLTRFRKCFPEEKIDIPGCFVPIFESIVATEPADNKYPWIVPHYGDLSNLTNINNFHGDTNLNFLRPMVPLMLANLAAFAGTAPTALNNYMFDDLFHPVNLHPAANANNVRAYNRTHDFTAAVAAPAAPAAAMTQEMRVFHTGGMSVRFAFYNDNAAAAHSHMRRTNFLGRLGIDIASTTGKSYPHGGNISESANNRSFATLENFLFLQKDKSGHWADYIFNQLSIAAKHCTDNRNLSEIATTGGMESTILCYLRTYQPNAHNGGNFYTYENADLGIADSSEVHWYRDDLMRNMTARFQTSRADVEREEELQAFSIGINARLPIHGATFNVQGSFFSHAQVRAANAEEAMLYSEHGDYSDTVRGPVNMYEGWEQNIVRPGFLPKPAHV